MNQFSNDKPVRMCRLEDGTVHQYSMADKNNPSHSPTFRQFAEALNYLGKGEIHTINGIPQSNPDSRVLHFWGYL